jgi:hypothetical protein
LRGQATSLGLPSHTTATRPVVYERRDERDE